MLTDLYASFLSTLSLPDLQAEHEELKTRLDVATPLDDTIVRIKINLICTEVLSRAMTVIQ